MAHEDRAIANASHVRLERRHQNPAGGNMQPATESDLVHRSGDKASGRAKAQEIIGSCCVGRRCAGEVVIPKAVVDQACQRGVGQHQRRAADDMGSSLTPSVANAHATASAMRLWDR